MSVTKKHRHSYSKIAGWHCSPVHPDDKSRYWYFRVNRLCDCGAIYADEATLSEVEEYIKNATCSSCGAMKNHASPSDCIRDLHLRVQFLEDRLEKVCDALSGIGR